MANLSNSNQNFVNPHFDLIRLWIQENIGKFVVILLAITYLATGFFIGLALQQGLTVFGAYLSWITAMSVAVIGQMIRGSLVYFSQANPYRIGGNAHVVGTAAALLLTVYACYEVIHLLGAIEVSAAFQTSIVGLIIGGFFVEVFFLNELNKINAATLVNDEKLFEQALENEKKLAEIKIKGMEARVMLVQARRSRLRQALSQKPTPTPSEPEQPEQPEPAPKLNFSAALLDAIGAADNLTDQQMQQIRQWMQEGLKDSEIIGYIQGMSEKNQQRRTERADAKAHNVPLDFSESEAADKPHPLQEAIRSSQNGQPEDEETLRQLAEAEALVEGVNLHRVEVRPRSEFSSNGKH